MFLRGGGHKRSPRYAVITHAAVLFAMGLLVVKAALRHVCTLRPLSLSLSPQATCHSRGGPALSGCAHVHNTNKPPTTITTTGVNVPSPPYPTVPTVHTRLPSKEKQNQTEKRQNGPTLLPLSKLLTGPSRGPQRRIQLKMMTAEITSQVVVLQHSYTLALVCPFGYSEALQS